MQFCDSAFCKVVQKHYLGEVGKKHFLIAYFQSNIAAKNCQNRFMFVKVIASHASELFWRHSVVSDHLDSVYW